jgi:SAM-dependent MidA family methyltransferase
MQSQQKREKPTIYIITFQKKLKKLQKKDMNNSNSKQNIKNMMCPQRLVTMYCNKLFDTMCYERRSCLGKTPYLTLEQV